MTCKILSNYLKISITLLAILVFVPTGELLAATATDGNNFDIPISELTKVKKNKPVKHAAKKLKRKEAKIAKKEKATSIKPMQSLSTENKTTTNGDNSINMNLLSTVVKVEIYHTPYSFVTANNRTTVYAVINSAEDVRSINCTMINGSKKVQMAKVTGTQFTYSATLPAVSNDTTFLKYTINVVDSTGKVTSSQEFSAPVTTSLFVPSWQIADKQ